MEEDNYQNLYDYALRLLSLRPRSIKEMTEKLRKYSSRRDFPAKFVSQVLEELKTRKYIDDREFSQWWKEQRQLSKPKGRRAIKMELLQKGIDRSVIDEIISEKEEGKTEYDLAERVVSKKINILKHLPKEKLKMRVRDMLLRRGFDWDTIYKIIDSLAKKT